MALITLHRVNTIDALQKIDSRFGVEIDIRHNPATGRLYLNHDPGTGDDFEEYIRVASTKNLPLIILNIKEAGIEKTVIETVATHKIRDWFLLDVEFPFIYKAAHAGVLGLEGRIAIRYSESEPIEQALLLAGKYKWVWVDVNSTLPLDTTSYKRLRDAGYKLALVCPERWGRPQDIAPYIAYMKEHGIQVDTVMTSQSHADEWEKSGVVL
jgi:hypothetical protein